MPESRSHAGFYLVPEKRFHQLTPGPLWIGDEGYAVVRFFDKMRSDGFEFLPMSAERMLMKAPFKRPDWVVWLEREDGRKVALSTFLS